MQGISRLALTDACEARLTVPGLTVYRGEVPGSPPVIPDSGGRVLPYVVLHPSPGTPSPDGRDLADSFTALDWLLQVTVVTGWSSDLDATVDLVDGRLLGWSPAIDEVACSPTQPPLGFDPGPARRDDEVKPPRHYVPLLYALTATR